MSGRSLVQRLIEALATLVMLSVVVFALSRATGNPLDLLLPSDASVEDYERVGKSLGLDRPAIVQYAIFAANAVRGDLGRSLRSGEPVASLLLQRLEGSLPLALLALLLSLSFGIPLGVLAAVHRGTSVDTAAGVVAILGQSMPTFWVGMALVQVFAVGLGWFPSGTMSGVSSIILPATTLALNGVAVIARLVRSAMLDVLHADFVKLARAKGLSEATVIWRHALRNALLAVSSYAGILFVSFLTLAIVVEVVFAWPGIGQLTYSAILNRDFPVVQGVTLLGGLLTVLVSLVVDMLAYYLDPRIRYADL